jgi:hypothetical protein
MTDTTVTNGAGATAPADSTPAPKSDAEAALQAQAAPSEPTEPTAEQKAAEQEAARQAEEKKRNRTRSYIDRINAERAELQRRVAELESRQSPTQPVAPQTNRQQADTGPSLEQYGYDFNAWTQARDTWVLQQAEQRFTTTAQQRAEQAREQELWQSYETRAADFAGEHEDFFEVVGSMPPLPTQLQAAIASHPNGPAIAYHLGNNPSELLQFAAVPPQLASYAVQQYAARMGSAPAAPQPPAAPPVAPAKPITQAPPPPPQVGGRAATETPPHKLTDDDWYERQRAKRKG